jgi:hypothetical protein
MVWSHAPIAQAHTLLLVRIAPVTEAGNVGIAWGWVTLLIPYAMERESALIVLAPDTTIFPAQIAKELGK